MAEMALILRAVNRIEVIRKTVFAAIVYLLACVASGVLCTSLTLTKGDSTSYYNNNFFLFSLSRGY